jgi:hypothetical protein
VWVWRTGYAGPPWNDFLAGLTLNIMWLYLGERGTRVLFQVFSSSFAAWIFERWSCFALYGMSVPMI